MIRMLQHRYYRNGKKPIKRVSDKQKKINECLKLYRILLKHKHGNKCMLCGRPQEQLPFPLSIFHIKPRSTHRRIILCEFNLLLACWGPQGAYYIKSPWCHNQWETGLRDDPRRKEIEKRIIELRGIGYSDYLDSLNVIEPKLTMLQIEGYLKWLRWEVEQIEGI